MGGLYEGEIIKIFPETDVKTYTNWIHDEGFMCYVYRDHIKVGKRIRETRKYDNQKLGNLIRNKRKAKGITRYKLSQLAHVHESTVFEWEMGAKHPRYATIDRLEQILGITKEELERCRK